jgi:uncharacterized protein
MLANGP